MSRKLFIVPFAALLVAGAANAGTAQNAGTLQTLTLTERAQSRDQLAAEVVEVQTRRSAAAVIAQDALYGGIAGLAIGAGVALLNGGDNWGRDLAIGAGAGLLIGGVFGAVDAAANADRAPVGFNNPYRLTSANF
jgi:hypothetical protein